MSTTTHVAAPTVIDTRIGRARSLPSATALAAVQSASRAAGMAAGNSDTVAQPAARPTVAPFTQSVCVGGPPEVLLVDLSDAASALSRVAAANAHTRHPADNAWPMKIV